MDQWAHSVKGGFIYLYDDVCLLSFPLQTACAFVPVHCTINVISEWCCQRHLPQNPQTSLKYLAFHHLRSYLLFSAILTLPSCEGVVQFCGALCDLVDPEETDQKRLRYEVAKSASIIHCFLGTESYPCRSKSHYFLFPLMAFMLNLVTSITQSL